MSIDRKFDPAYLNQVAEFGSGLSYDAIPENVRSAAKRFLADTVAVTLAGKASPSTDGIIKTAQTWNGGQSGPARVLGNPGMTLSPANAAFVNGYKAHCLEWDALHEEGVAIAFCTPFAALLAESDARNVKGDDFLTALIAAVELFIVLGLSAGSPATFFRPSAGGTLCAALAIARVRNYSVEQTQQTVALAYSLAGGTMQAHWEGTTTLSMQVGAAARSAIYAADLAENGIAAPVDIFTGKFGFFTLFESPGSFEDRIKNLGKTWHIPEVAFKPFPCGRATHGVLTVLRELQQEEALDPNEIERVTVTAPPLLSRLVNRPVKQEMSPGYARLCLPFVFTMFCYHGDIDPRAFVDPIKPTERGIALAERLTVNIVEGAPTNTLFPVDVSIDLKNGERRDLHCAAPWGTPENPFTDVDLRDKIKKCIEISELKIDVSTFEDVFANFDTADNVGRALDPLYA